MDRTLIIMGNREDIISDLRVIDQIAAAHWASQGYIVEHSMTGLELVGKNAQTGEDVFESQKTTTWDEVKEHQGFFYIVSPSNNPKYSEWKIRGEDLGYVWKGQEVEKDWEYVSDN